MLLPGADVGPKLRQLMESWNDTPVLSIRHFMRKPLDRGSHAGSGDFLAPLQLAGGEGKAQDNYQLASCLAEGAHWFASVSKCRLFIVMLGKQRAALASPGAEAKHGGAAAGEAPAWERALLNVVHSWRGLYDAMTGGTITFSQVHAMVSVCAPGAVGEAELQARCACLLCRAGHICRPQPRAGDAVRCRERCVVGSDAL